MGSYFVSLILSLFLFIAIIPGYWLDFHMSWNLLGYFQILFPWESPSFITEAFIWQCPTSFSFHFFPRFPHCSVQSWWRKLRPREHFPTPFIPSFKNQKRLRQNSHSFDFSAVFPLTSSLVYREISTL